MGNRENNISEEQKWIGTYVSLNDDLSIIGSEEALLRLSSAIAADAKDTVGISLSIFRLAEILQAMKDDKIIGRDDDDQLLAVVI